MRTAFTRSFAQLSLVNWQAVGFFYALACGLSYALHFLPNPTEGMLPMHDIFTYGMGPLLAAILTQHVFSTQPRTITVLGTSRLKTVLFVMTPILLSVIIGVRNRSGQNEHLYGLLLGVSGLLYGLGEEMGWRGWLQDALRPLPTFWRVVLIGLMHAGWHLTFLPNLSAVSGGQVNGLVVIGILMLMAWGLGALVNQTKSVLVVACAHELMNIAVHPAALAVTLLIWIWLTRSWHRKIVFKRGCQVTLLAILAIGFFMSSWMVVQSDILSGSAVPKPKIVLIRASSCSA